MLYDISKAIGVAMVELGKAKIDEPTTFTKEDLDKYFDGVREPFFCFDTRTRLILRCDSRTTLEATLAAAANDLVQLGGSQSKSPKTCSRASSLKWKLSLRTRERRS